MHAAVQKLNSFAALTLFARACRLVGGKSHRYSRSHHREDVARSHVLAVRTVLDADVVAVLELPAVDAVEECRVVAQGSNDP